MIKWIAEYLNRQSGGNITGLFIFSYVLKGLILITVFLSVHFFIKYLREYRIFSGLIAKIKGNTREYDRIRRQQLKQDLENRGQLFAKHDEKDSFVRSLYQQISMTGIVEKIPGFSEMSFIISVIVVDVLLTLFIFWKRGALTALIIAAVFMIVVWYTLSMLIYSRRMKLESQLLLFINACTSASMQYSSLIDIFGAIYEQFKNPLRDALEACYVEAKQTSNKDQAIKHLVEKFDSPQFAFVIENLELCSSVTGNYHDVARDISDTVAIYITSHEKKRVLLRNAKVNLLIMFGMSLVILFAMSLFIGGLKEVLFNTFAGNMGLLMLAMLLFYGMNMRTES